MMIELEKQNHDCSVDNLQRNAFLENDDIEN